jgi:hypothetical protein
MLIKYKDVNIINFAPAKYFKYMYMFVCIKTGRLPSAETSFIKKYGQRARRFIQSCFLLIWLINAFLVNAGASVGSN